ncbi:MAG TPA: hypothetical protein RMI62_25345, partial [Polyangiaceae bacterium LLY-WYZ-15_(1-7)]|nr:hypothetical protein [Polyangiaceae bacterium LLY-WYZ-15_(1-7)]
MSDEAPTRLAGRPPPLFDLRLGQGLLLSMLAVVVGGLAAWRELATGSPMDRLAIPLRFLTLVLLVRGLAGLRLLLRRIRLRGAARGHRLELGDDALVWTRPEGALRVSKESIAGIVPPAEDGAHAPVHLLVTPEDGDALVRLPPVFGPPGALAEQLERWRGPVPAPDPLPERPLARAASPVYDAAAEGRPPEGGAVLRHGWGWLRRGPYAAVLFAVVFLEGTLRIPEGLELALLPKLAMAACALIPIGWLWMTVREIAPRRGLAMVITPAEVLMRTQAGVLRAPFDRLDGVGIDA